MDEDLRAPIRVTRWLAWAVAGLLAVGVVSVGVVDGRDDGSDQRVVTAAGESAGGVDVSTTVTTFVPPPELPVIPPPPDPTTTTTAVKPATTTTKRPATTTTTAKAPATTATTVAANPTTTVTVQAGVTLTVVNQYPGGVILTVNGTTFNLAAGQTVGPVNIVRYSHGNDIVELKLAADPSCGSGDADGYFPTPGSYRMTVVAGPSPVCQGGVVGPSVTTTKL